MSTSSGQGQAGDAGRLGCMNLHAFSLDSLSLHFLLSGILSAGLLIPSPWVTPLFYPTYLGPGVPTYTCVHPLGQVVQSVEGDSTTCSGHRS